MFKKVLFVIIGFFLWQSQCLAFDDIALYEQFYEKGEVQEVNDDIINVTVITGPYKNQNFEVNKSEMITNVPYKTGEQVQIFGQKNEDGISFSLMDKWHSTGLIIWIFIFFGLIILLGGINGLKAIVGLAISLILILFGIYSILHSTINPLIIFSLIIFAIVILTIPIILGWKLKSLYAVLGTLGGIISAIIMTFLISNSANLTGLGSEEAMMVYFLNSELNFKYILLSGFIIGALGAIMDVAISISSGIEEVIKHKPDIGGYDLMLSGISIGKDIMGSMLNTLILAYTGSSIFLILILMNHSESSAHFLNIGFISEEIAKSLVGSMGVLFTIPITAFAGGWIRRWR